jgi:chromosomal replication initiation ATPase DnaA
LLIENLGGHLSDGEQQALAEWLDRRKPGLTVGMSTQEELENLGGLTAALTSRCQSGLLVPCNEADEPTRKDLLIEHAKKLRLDLTDESLDVLAQGLPGDARTVRGALTRLAAECKMRGQQATPERAAQLVQSINSMQG